MKTEAEKHELNRKYIDNKSFVFFVRIIKPKNESDNNDKHISISVLKNKKQF